MCSTEGCHICVCMTSTFWLILVTAGWILSIQGWVEPHSPSVNATFWLVGLLQTFFYGFVWFIFLVAPLSCHWFYTVPHPSGNEAFTLYLRKVSVRKYISGSCGYGRARRCPETESEIRKIGWSSIGYWLLISWLLVIDQWSSVRCLLSINQWLVVNHWSPIRFYRSIDYWLLIND